MAMTVDKLPFQKQLAYASGMIGWSIMTNIIIVMLPYFYLPPSNAGLTPLLPQLLIFGLLNILPLIAASGRLVDALFDPFIASISDKSNNPAGRRIPFMKWAILPSVLFCCLVFKPVAMGESIYNAFGLAIALMLFFMSLTTYIIPYNALLPELTNTSSEKVKLSSFQQIGFIIGMIISGLVNNYARALQTAFHIVNADQAIQYTIWGLCLFAGAMMLIPVLAINEKQYSNSKPSHLPLLPAIKKTFGNRNFKYYLISDFSYYMALSIISSGLLYFVTVLLKLPATRGGVMLAVMVLTSLLFYPLIIYLSKKIGKKPIVLFSFALLSLIFITIFFLGKFPVSANVQIYALALGASFPLASLGILPNAILAEIAEHEAQLTGENREGMFFAVKYLFVKLGQSLGIALFAFLTIYGKDPDRDYGLRLNGICGFVLCIAAFLVFSRFKERGTTG
ncbi:MFS transporter [Mucilaginibacter boryungensis]|nr:MFS transporter [Mucilaginibacter boryungensis]